MWSEWSDWTVKVKLQRDHASARLEKSTFFMTAERLLLKDDLLDTLHEI